MAQFDMKKLDTSDRIVAGAGALTLICLFLPWWGAGPFSVSGFSTSYGWIGAILIIAAAVYLVMLRSGSNMPKIPTDRASPCSDSQQSARSSSFYGG